MQGCSNEPHHLTFQHTTYRVFIYKISIHIMTVPITVQFSYVHVVLKSNGISLLILELRKSSGGLELMFDNKPSQIIRLPSKVPGTSESANIRYLLKYLCDELMTDTRKELFVLDDTMYEFYAFHHFRQFSVTIPTHTMSSYIPTSHFPTMANSIPQAVPVSWS